MILRGRLSKALTLIAVVQIGLAQSLSVTPSAIPDVEILTPPSAEYDAAVNRFFGPERSPNLNNWLPYGIVLTNRTSQTIVAVAARWVSSGDRGAGHFVLEHSAFNNAGSQLRPGKTAVAFPNLTLVLDGSQLPPSFQLTPQPGSIAGDNTLSDLKSAAGIQFTLDGVVFASGQFVGPNGAREYEEYVAETTVPAQISGKVLAMQAASESVQSIVAWLQATRDQPVNRKVDGWQNSQMASRIARRLLMSYRSGGETKLSETAQLLVQVPPFHLYR